MSTRTPHRPAQPGAVLMGTVLAGRYELGESIGRGGMAEVFAANDQRLERTVAVKVLMPDAARDSSFEERFRREAKVAAALNHPAIVGIYDTGEDVPPHGNRVSYIVMEHVAGRTVRELLADGAMNVDEALEIVVGVLSALEYSHRAGIVHRDIKPANVMVTGNGAVKVMDFGIARALDGVSGLTQSWSVVGTAQYMSPEQARGEPVDARSDLYSTGCLLFELLTGQPPFAAESMVAVAYKHIAEQPPAPSMLNPTLPPVLDQIVARALTKDREVRYQSAAELRADLQAVRRGEPVVVAPVPVMAAAYPSPVPAAPPPGVQAALGGTAVLPVVGQVAYGYPVTTGTGPGYPPQADRPRSLGWIIGTEIVVAVLALAGIAYFLLT